MLVNFNNLAQWCRGPTSFSKAILLCLHAAFLFLSVVGTSAGTTEPQKYSLHMIDLNAEHRRLVPISGYVQFGGNLVGDTNRGEFGESVTIDETGTTIVVHERQTGIVRVYENAANGWTPKGQVLTGFPVSFIFNSGRSVAISRDGSIVAVGSTNNRVVFVFQYNTSADMWVQRGSTIQGVERDGTSPIASFGFSISMSADGNKIAVGAPEYDSPTLLDIGFATNYFWNGTDWERYDYFGDISGFYGEIQNAQLGASVAFSGDGSWFAIGMPGSGSSESLATRFGECRVYNIESLVVQTNIVDGGAMFGSAINDRFGNSVALSYDGSIIAVGSPGFDGDFSNTIGRVQVFERIGETWRQLGSDLIGDNEIDGFGSTIDLSDDGKTLVAGSVTVFLGSTPTPSRGYTRIYKFDGTDWVLQEISRAQGFDIDGIREGDELGWSVAVSGDGTKVLVGAPFYDGPDTNNGLVQMWGQTDFPTFSPILNPLPQVGNLGTGGSPAQASLVSRAFTWWQGAVAYLEGFFVFN
ncbi:expressed unknown protein [Seminavis robusta]|uniref:Uncharacterized protein n=1 Tax=Seminavis robusta TaxID=568900 RepID=A0A9N8DIX6_9STRA|nr:expressed unknown protein [Seminavis robusta]|eukprot:Sro183_g079671.1  (525) ;mRNA; f:51639-53304